MNSARASRFFSLVALMLVFVFGSARSAVAADAASAAPAPTSLKVATRVITPFVVKEGDRYTGFSMDLWKTIAAEMKVSYTIVEKPNVKDLLEAVHSKEADMGVAAISITSARNVEFDFSQPIYDGGLQVMVPAQSGDHAPLLSTVKDMFTADLLKLVGIFLVLMLIPAHLIWLLERHRGEDGIVGTKKYLAGILKTSWWSMATLATQADEMPKSYPGRIVATLWMFVSVVFVAFFTAQITTNLTLKSLQGDIHGIDDLPGKSVATTRGSTSEKYLADRGVKVVPVEKIEDAYELLQKKSVAAVVYDAPVLSYYVSHQGKGQADLAGPVFKRESYGIAVPSNSPLRKDINLALLKLKEDGTYEEIYRKWFSEN